MKSRKEGVNPSFLNYFFVVFFAVVFFVVAFFVAGFFVPQAILSPPFKSIVCESDFFVKKEITPVMMMTLVPCLKVI